MKKFFVLFSAVALICAFAMPAAAMSETDVEEKLAELEAKSKMVKFYGSMRVEGYDVETFGGSEGSYLDQRFRIGTRFTPADGVYAEVRMDYSEAVWGSQYGEGSGGLIVRPNRGTGNALDIDRAFLNVNKGMFSLRGGLQYIGVGATYVLDANATGLKAGFNFDPVKVTGIFIKDSENGSTNDDDANDDLNAYGLDVAGTFGGFKLNLFTLMHDGNVAVEDENENVTATDRSLLAVGLTAKATLGMVDLVTELTNFSGDAETTDFMGTQFYLDANAKLSDNLSVAGQVLYALGTDDASEDQITGLCDWWSFTPFLKRSGWDAWYRVSQDDPFDPSGDNAGVMGLYVDAQFSPMEALKLGTSLAYVEPETEDVTTLESLFAFGIYAAYQVAPNTKLHFLYMNSEPSVDGTHDSFVDGEADQRIATRLQVDF